MMELAFIEVALLLDSPSIRAYGGSAIPLRTAAKPFTVQDFLLNVFAESHYPRCGAVGVGADFEHSLAGMINDTGR